MSTYITRSGRQTKKVNYKDTRTYNYKPRVAQKKQPSKRRKRHVRKSNNIGKTVAPPIDPNQLSGIITALYPPSTTHECEYISSLWRSIHTFSEEMVTINDNYKKETARKRKSTASIASSAPASKKQKTELRTGRIYKLRRPRTAWIIYNGVKTKALLAKHASLTVSEGSKINAKAWHGLSNKERAIWVKKAKKERATYLKIKADFDRHHDFSKVSDKWKKIDNKAESVRKVMLAKENINESENGSVDDMDMDVDIVVAKKQNKRRRSSRRWSRGRQKKVEIKEVGDGERGGTCMYCAKPFASIGLTISHMEKLHGFRHY